MPEGTALWMAPESPYPLAGGGAMRCASLLNYLARRYVVDAIVFREPGADDPRLLLPPGLVRRLLVLELAPHRRNLAARALRNAGRLARGVPPLVDRFAGFGDAVAAFVAGRRYDVALIEHFWCAPYWEQVAGAASLTALDLHNVESALHSSCARSEPRGQAFVHRLFARACLRLERRWLPRYGLLLAASEDDASRVLRIAQEARVAVYRNALPFVPAPEREPGDVIAFSGNFDYHPNRTAVEYFAHAIWPRLRARRPGLKWRLIGRNAEAVSRMFAGDERVHATGPVRDSVAELARVRVAVVPLLSGSGTRIKILEAWAAGTPVVSTTLGAEGLSAVDGVNILLADSPVTFCTAVERLLDDADLSARTAAAGRRIFEKEHTWESVWLSLSL